MTGRHAFSRRLLLRLAGALLVPVGIGWAGEERPADRGIGGTGFPRTARKVSATKLFIGTIQRLGSIYVNGAHILFAARTKVFVDGRRAGTAALRPGQVVEVATRAATGHLYAADIHIVHEVVGRIESLDADRMTVLGQTILTRGVPVERWWRPGARVAVSGLRWPDDTVAASRIEPARRRDGERVRGVLRRAGERYFVGGLDADGVDPNRLGETIVLVGSTRRGGFRVTSVGSGRAIADETFESISAETYVVREDGVLKAFDGTEVAVPHPGFGRRDEVMHVYVDVDSRGVPSLNQERGDGADRHGGDPGRTGDATPRAGTGRDDGAFDGVGSRRNDTDPVSRGFEPDSDVDFGTPGSSGPRGDGGSMR